MTNKNGNVELPTEENGCMSENKLWKDILAHVDVRFTPKEQAMIDRIKKKKQDSQPGNWPTVARRVAPPCMITSQRSKEMKNKAIDLHNILFEQLERLNDLDKDEMQTEKLTNEIRRAEAMNKVAAQLVSNGRMVLDAMKFAAGDPDIELPEMFAVRSLPAPNLVGRK
jgi:hypothetical protein